MRLKPVIRPIQLAMASNTAPSTIAAKTSMKKRFSSIANQKTPMIVKTITVDIATWPKLGKRGVSGLVLARNGGVALFSGWCMQI